jgi:hypothetical protein
MFGTVDFNQLFLSHFRVDEGGAFFVVGSEELESVKLIGVVDDITLLVVPDGCKGERKAYKIEVIPGELDAVQSFATVDTESNQDSNVFTAGSQISFIAEGKDKQGNVIDYTNKLDRFKLFAAYNEEGSTLVYSEMTQKELVEVNGAKHVKWTLPFTKAGEYELIAAYDDKKVRCEVCKV